MQASRIRSASNPAIRSAPRAGCRQQVALHLSNRSQFLASGMEWLKSGLRTCWSMHSSSVPAHYDSLYLFMYDLNECHPQKIILRGDRSMRVFPISTGQNPQHKAPPKNETHTTLGAYLRSSPGGKSGQCPWRRGAWRTREFVFPKRRDVSKRSFKPLRSDGNRDGSTEFRP